MNDLISRQMVIDKIEPWLKVKGYSEGELNMLKAVLYELRTLPSAQPETATVSIGKTRGTDVLWYQCDGCGEPVVKEDRYCSNCGRRLRFE